MFVLAEKEPIFLYFSTVTRMLEIYWLTIKTESRNQLTFFDYMYRSKIKKKN